MAEDTKEAEEDRERHGETPWGGPVEVTRVGEDATPPEENADLPGFHAERAHLFLQGVYGDFPHHNKRVAPGQGNSRLQTGRG